MSARKAGSTHVDVEPASPERWADVMAVMGERGDASRCWCQYFHLSGRQWAASSAGAKRDRLRRQVQAPDGPPPGVLAYADGAPVGWCAVAPRRSYPRLGRSPLAKAASDDPDASRTWAVVCFQVVPAARRAGVAARLLDGAIALARNHGAECVEAYPYDVSRRPGVSLSELFPGTLQLFLRAGFGEVGRPAGARVVVRRALR